MNSKLMFHYARIYASRSDALYGHDRLSGSDPIDGERYRLVADAFRNIGAGTPLEEAIEHMKKEWYEFCDSQERKVKKAPKIRTGPRAGQSVIDYKWAYKGSIDANEVCIRTIYSESQYE